MAKDIESSLVKKPPLDKIKELESVELDRLPENVTTVSHIREIGDDGDACRYEEMNTHLKNPVGGKPGDAYPSRDESSLAEMNVSLTRLCERCTHILHLYLPHLHCEGEGEEES